MRNEYNVGDVLFEMNNCSENIDTKNWDMLYVYMYVGVSSRVNVYFSCFMVTTIVDNIIILKSNRFYKMINNNVDDYIIL